MKIKSEHIIILILSILLIICLDKFQRIDTVQAMYTDMTAEQRADFIVWALKDDALARMAIAADWCHINGNTERVCYNATGGVK